MNNPGRVTNTHFAFDIAHLRLSRTPLHLLPRICSQHLVCLVPPDTWVAERYTPTSTQATYISRSHHDPGIRKRHEGDGDMASLFRSVLSGSIFGAALIAAGVYSPRVIIGQMQLGDFHMLKTFLAASASSA